MPQSNLGLLAKLPKFQVPMVKRVYKLAVKRTFASCWHMSDGRPSNRAWDSFGGAGDGVALRTTPVALSDAVSKLTGDDGPTYLGEVRYIDHWRDVIPEANVLEAAFVVRKDFWREREARIVIHTHGTAAADYLANRQGLFGTLVKRPQERQLNAGSFGFLGGHARWKAVVPIVDARQLIHEIRIGKRVSTKDRKDIERISREYGLIDRLDG